jgi:hypothetical protein
MRVLLWGDPEFARRFAESTHLYDGDGFEVTEPLGTKMQAQPHDQKPFDLMRSQYRYYDYEFERYWHFYQVFGRMAYNPNTPTEVWDREFARRFGPDAGPVIEKALHRASWILPRINASVFPYPNFPTTRGWAEKQRWGDLAQYAKEAEGSDTAQFEGIDEAARNRVEDIESAKLPPGKTFEWLYKASRDVLQAVDEAERRVGAYRNKEFDSTVVDLRILAQLAAYHAHRIKAGEYYAVFVRTGDLIELDTAITFESNAVREWEALVAAAGDVYADDLEMGRRSVDLCGHWRDELAALRKGLAALEEERRQLQLKTNDTLSIAHVPWRKIRLGRDVSFTLRATVSGPEPIKSVSILLNRSGQKPVRIPMQPVGRSSYAGLVVGVGVDGYQIEAEDVTGRRVAFPPGETNRIHVLISSDDDAPVLQHQPITTARPGQPLRITAQVSDASGVKWVRLRYRPVNQTMDYETLAMKPTGSKDEYEVTVPADKIVSKWDFMYFFEVMDNSGNGKIYPDFEKETPYVVVKLRR